MENASLELVEDDIEDVVDVIAVCPYHAYDSEIYFSLVYTTSYNYFS